jgi:hypothetical protein
LPRSNARLFVKDWESSLTISAKPVGVGAAYQPLIQRGEQSGLRTHRDDNQRFVVHADEKLTAFLEIQRAIHQFAVDLIS